MEFMIDTIIYTINEKCPYCKKRAWWIKGFDLLVKLQIRCKQCGKISYLRYGHLERDFPIFYEKDENNEWKRTEVIIPELI